MGVRRWPGFAALLIAGLAAVPGDAARYRTRGTCDGFPRVDLSTAPGLCVGLVAQGIGFLRGIAVLGDDVYLTDLGSRSSGRGRLLRLRRSGRAAPEVVLDGLDRPNGILPDGAGGLYVAEATRVIRLDPAAADVRASVRPVLVGLPGDGLHPLKSLAAMPDGALVVSIGSRSNNCEGEDGRAPDPRGFCPERQARPPRGALLRFRPRPGAPLDARFAEVLASGLRNPAAISAAPDGTVLAASNARDSIDEADPRLSDERLPHDTLLRVEPGDDFGWPYCFDRGRASPEYLRFPCRTKKPPLLLLPPHSAPLAMLAYRGDRLPGLKGKLVVALHGYRAAGHRLVALSPDRPDTPLANAVAGWTAHAGVGPRGAPTALAELPDGSLLVAEDLNRSLLRVSVSP